MKHQVATFLAPAKALLALALVWSALASAGPVLADEGHGEEAHGAASGPTITFEPPPEMAVGKESTLVASLTGSGPLAGAEVVFLATVSFAMTEGEVELGRAVTDQQGNALLTYLPRSQGEMTIAARFPGDGQVGPAEVSHKVMVLPGPPIYQETAGVRVPGIGVWLLVAVLAAVWATYLTVTVILGAIASKGLAPQAEGRQVQAPAYVAAYARGAADD